MELNPANAGAEFDLRAGLNYPTQWGSLTKSFVIMITEYDMNFKSSKPKKDDSKWIRYKPAKKKLTNLFF